MSSIDYEYIINEIKENYDPKKDDLYDITHQVIDEYAVSNDYEARQEVEKYGTIKAIKEYTENYSDFDLKRPTLNCYLTLYYHIIYEEIINSTIYKKLQAETDDDKNYQTLNVCIAV